MRNKLVLFVLGALISSGGATFGLSDAELPRYEAVIRAMMSDLERIVGSSSADDLVHEALRAGRTAEQDGIPYLLHEKGEGILDGMSFTHEKDTGQFGLSFGTAFLDSYWTGSTAHLSVLVHELWHLRDYRRDSVAFTKGSNDAKEKFWYELDAMHVEAEFVKNYLDPDSLSRFEAFVLQSYTNDNLNGLAMVLHKQSEKVFFYFDNLEKIFRSGEKSGNELISDLAGEGRKLLDRYGSMEAKTSFSHYTAYTEVSTFQKHMLRTLPLFLNRPTMTWAEVFKQYPSIKSFYDEALVVLGRDSSIQDDYRRGLVKWWEDDITQRRPRP